jgi:CDP-diglyceride synthetase
MTEKKYGINYLALKLCKSFTLLRLCVSFLMFWEILDMENMSDVRIKILTFQVLYVAFTKVFEPFIDGFLAWWWFIGFNIMHSQQM